MQFLGQIPLQTPQEQHSPCSTVVDTVFMALPLQQTQDQGLRFGKFLPLPEGQEKDHIGDHHADAAPDQNSRDALGADLADAQGHRSSHRHHRQMF